MKRSFIFVFLLVLAIGCGDRKSTSTSTATTFVSVPSPTATPSSTTDVPLEVVPPPIFVVLFTHIEDNTPSGALGTEPAHKMFLQWRNSLIAMALDAKRLNFTWVLQPDWKFLLATQMYEDATTMSLTNGKNVLQYLHEDLGVVIDPHSHENGGYNYTDVAYLLEQLGVGGTTVIGGHIWDPSLPQFAHWERFRDPVAGEHYPSATWQGNILMGSGTPNHQNDPIVSGVWHPQDPTHFWVDDPSGNIVSVGAYTSDIAGIGALADLYRTGKIDATCMLTSTYHVTPKMLSNPNELAGLETEVLAPFIALRDSGEIVITDFTSLIDTWQNEFGGKGCLYQE